MAQHRAQGIVGSEPRKAASATLAYPIGWAGADSKALLGKNVDPS